MGKVIINQEVCKGCGLCIKFCPRDVLAFSADSNNKGYHPVEVKNGEGCTGCGSCYKVCPDCCFEVYK